MNQSGKTIRTRERERERQQKSNLKAGRLN